LLCSDQTANLEKTRSIVEEYLGVKDSTLEERKALQVIAEHLGLRAARLSAMALSAVVRQGGYLQDGCTVAIDGSIFQHYPNFQKQMEDALCILLGEDARAKFSLQMAKDGSGVGAAVISFVH
jgi:hexokinase